MLPETLAPAERAGREEAIERHIVQRTWGRLHRLQIEVAEDRVVIRGTTASYYIKQLALHALREVLETTPVEIDIQVGAGEPSMPQGHDGP